MKRTEKCSVQPVIRVLGREENKGRAGFVLIRLNITTEIMFAGVDDKPEDCSVIKPCVHSTEVSLGLRYLRQAYALMFLIT